MPHFIYFKCKNDLPTNSHPLLLPLLLFISTSSQTKPETESSLSTKKQLFQFHLQVLVLLSIVNEMLELKKPLNFKNRGFYLRMKLLNKHSNRPHQQDNNKTCLFFTYYKWLLWLSLSLYFFTSYLISNEPQTQTQPSSTSKSNGNNTNSSAFSVHCILFI